MSDEALIPQELTPEVKINDEIAGALAKVNITETVIAGLKEKYLPLTIGGQEDKEGYLAVQEARKECKRWRVLAKNTCKKGREDAIAIQNAWIKKEKDVTGRIGEVEDHLEKQETAWEQERDRIKAEAKARQEQQFAARLVELTKMGGEFTGTHFKVGDDEFEAVLVREVDDEIYQSTILPPFKAAWEAAERQRIEQERIEAEAKAKAEAERIEFERKQKEQEEKEAALKAEADRIAALKQEQEEAEARRIAAEERVKFEYRLQQLTGYNYNGFTVSFEGNIVGNMADILNIPEDEFKALVQTHNDDLAARKQREEEERKRKAEQDKEAAIAKALQEERDRQAKAKAEADEAERLQLIKNQEELDKASDKQKWGHITSILQGIQWPEFKSGQYRNKANTLREYINHAIK